MNDTIISLISNENEKKANSFKKTIFKCPFCNASIWSTRDVTGMMVWCGASDCKSAETPFGHALSDNRLSDEKLEKAAFEVLLTKANKSMGLRND